MRTGYAYSCTLSAIARVNTSAAANASARFAHTCRRTRIGACKQALALPLSKCTSGMPCVCGRACAFACTHECAHHPRLYIPWLTQIWSTQTTGCEGASSGDGTIENPRSSFAFLQSMLPRSITPCALTLADTKACRNRAYFSTLYASFAALSWQKVLAISAISTWDIDKGRISSRIAPVIW